MYKSNPKAKVKATKASPILEDPTEISLSHLYNNDHPVVGITTPEMNDVLYGRGGGTNHHVGNRKFRVLIDEFKPRYLKAKRVDKPLIAMEVVNKWRSQKPPGRFLKEKDKKWCDVGDPRAREKTSQALREKAAVMRQCLGMDNNGNSISSVDFKRKKQAKRMSLSDVPHTTPLEPSIDRTTPELPPPVRHAMFNQPRPPVHSKRETSHEIAPIKGEKRRPPMPKSLQYREHSLALNSLPGGSTRTFGRNVFHGAIGGGFVEHLEMESFSQYRGYSKNYKPHVENQNSITRTLSETIYGSIQERETIQPDSCNSLDSNCINIVKNEFDNSKESQGSESGEDSLKSHLSSKGMGEVNHSTCDGLGRDIFESANSVTSEENSSNKILPDDQVLDELRLEDAILELTEDKLFIDEDIFSCSNGSINAFNDQAVHENIFSTPNGSNNEVKMSASSLPSLDDLGRNEEIVTTSESSQEIRRHLGQPSLENKAKQTYKPDDKPSLKCSTKPLPISQRENTIDTIPNCAFIPPKNLKERKTSCGSISSDLSDDLCELDGTTNANLEASARNSDLLKSNIDHSSNQSIEPIEDSSKSSRIDELEVPPQSAGRRISSSSTSNPFRHGTTAMFERMRLTQSPNFFLPPGRTASGELLRRMLREHSRTLENDLGGQIYDVSRSSSLSHVENRSSSISTSYPMDVYPPPGVNPLRYMNSTSSTSSIGPFFFPERNTSNTHLGSAQQSRWKSIQEHEHSTSSYTSCLDFPPK